MQGLLDLDDPTPLGLAYLNLVLACAIPVTWILTRVLHGLRPRWLASVAGGIRWRWLLVCFGLSVVSLLATLLVSALVPVSAGDAQVSTEVNDFTRTTRDFLLVVVLLTPLQAAGEEYAFRGYLTQAFGGLFRRPWVAVAGPALLFALAHGAQDPPVFFDRFAFGVVAGVLVIATGGLEAGIAMHVLNNWLAFGLALAFGDMGSALNPTGGTWWSLPVTLTQSLVYLGLAIFVARRMGIATATSPAVLAAPSRRV
jgi:membrane protease YdiL (CAAX protease family)